MNKINNSLLLVLGAAIMLTGCKTHYDMSSPEETNLQSLNRITDNEDNKFDTPFGGDNGKDLFFGVRDKRGSSNIYKKDNPVSAAMSPKTNGNNLFFSPTYCPTTNQVAFSGRQEGAMVSDLFMMEATQGVSLRRLTNTPSEIESWPCLSADGRTVVFEKCFLGGLNRDAQIWRQDLQTESQTLLCQGRMPAMSHDGHSIVFVRYTPDGNSTCIVVMNIDGQGQTELTDAKMGLVSHPHFSPDDQQIVFQCNKKDKRDEDLWVVNRDGTGLTQLTFNKSHDAEPYWANDGHIYFSSDRGGRAGNYQIWRFKYGNFNSSYRPKTAQTTPNPVNVIQTNTEPAAQPVPSSNVYHIVKDGETITNIARQYGVTVRDIVKWNNLTTMTINSGMKLIVGTRK